MKSVRQTRRVNVEAVVYDVMDMNFIQTSQVKASLKQKACGAEDRNCYLDIETHKRVIIDKHQHMHLFTFNTVLV